MNSLTIQSFDHKKENMKIKKRLHGFLIAIFIITMAAIGSQPVSAQAAEPLSITGWFSIIWGYVLQARLRQIRSTHLQIVMEK